MRKRKCFINSAEATGNLTLLCEQARRNLRRHVNFGGSDMRFVAKKSNKSGALHEVSEKRAQLGLPQLPQGADF